MTKYYYDNHNDDGILEEVPLNKDNWWYVMLDSSIRTIFKKYEFELPKYVIVDSYTNICWIYVIRQDINDIETANKWKNKKVFIEDELDTQAEANSYHDFDEEIEINYKFRII